MCVSRRRQSSGAYLAAKSEREIFEAGFKSQRDAVEYNEPEAREVLALYYQMKGLPEEDAKRFVDDLAKDKEQLVQALAHERLNTTEMGLRKPWVFRLVRRAFDSCRRFHPGGSLLLHGRYSGSHCCCGCFIDSHFAVGAAKSLVTIRSWWSSGFEMTVIGAIEGAVTYVIGIGLGTIGGG